MGYINRKQGGEGVVEGVRVWVGPHCSGVRFHHFAEQNVIGSAHIACLCLAMQLKVYMVYKVQLLFLEQLTQHPPFTRPTRQLPHVQLFAWTEKQI